MEGGPAEPMFVLATAHGRADAVCRVLAYGLLAFPRRGADANHALCVQNFRGPRWESWSPRILPVPFPRALWPRAPRQCTPSEAPRRGQRPGSPEATCWSPSMRPFWSPSFGRTKPRNQNSGPQITMRRDLGRFGVRRILELFQAPGETANGNACPAGQMDAPDAACAKHRGRDRRQSADAVLGAQGRQYQGVRPPLQSTSWPMF